MSFQGAQRLSVKSSIQRPFFVLIVYGFVGDVNDRPRGSLCRPCFEGGLNQLGEGKRRECVVVNLPCLSQSLVYLVLGGITGECRLCACALSDLREDIVYRDCLRFAGWQKTCPVVRVAYELAIDQNLEAAFQ